MAPQVAHYLAAAGRVADMHRILEVEMCGQHRQVVGVVIHVMAIAGLGGTTMSAAVVGDDPITLLQEEQHLRIPVIAREGPAVAEHDRLSLAPILIVDLGSIGGRDRWHRTVSLLG
jgi:hypothetical protein